MSSLVFQGVRGAYRSRLKDSETDIGTELRGLTLGEDRIAMLGSSSPDIARWRWVSVAVIAEEAGEVSIFLES